MCSLFTKDSLQSDYVTTSMSLSQYLHANYYFLCPAVSFESRFEGVFNFVWNSAVVVVACIAVSRGRRPQCYNDPVYCVNSDCVTSAYLHHSIHFPVLLHFLKLFLESASQSEELDDIQHSSDYDEGYSNFFLNLLHRRFIAVFTLFLSI